MKPSSSILAVVAALTLGLSACSAGHSGSAGSDVPRKSRAEARAEKQAAQADPAAEGSPLAKIQRGMSEDQVRQLLGAPTSSHDYMTGKEFIPGYNVVAKDSLQTEFVYKGIGSVIFDRSRWSHHLTVHNVVVDPNR